MADLDPVDLGITSPRARSDPGDASDRIAFEQFYRTEIAALVGFLLYLGGSPADAADAAQAAMIEAFRGWATIRHPKAWVRTVASRAHFRRLARVEEVTTAEVAEPSPLLPRPSAIAEWEQRHEVLRLIRLLPPRQRQVMAWTFDGYTPTEIAEALELDPATVRQNLRKARLALADRLNRPGGEGSGDA